MEQTDNLYLSSQDKCTFLIDVLFLLVILK